MLEDKISDDYLICLYYEKNQEAIDYLYERYTKFIFGIIKSIQNKMGIYVDFEELFQEAFF